MAPSESGTFEQIVTELSHALEPLASRLQPNFILPMLAEMGLKLPSGALSPALENAVAQTVTSAELLPGLIQDLVNAIEAEDIGDILSSGLQLAQQLITLISSLDTIATELNNLGPIPGLDPTDLTNFVNELPENLLDLLIVEYLEGYHGLISAVLELLGLVERLPMNVGSTDPLQPEYIQKSLRLDRLGAFLQSPEDIINDVYGWGNSSLDAALILKRIATLIRAFDVPVAEKELPGNRPALEIFLLTLTTTEGLTPQGLEAILMMAVAEGIQLEVPISDGVSLELNAQAALDSQLILRLQPPADVTLLPPDGSVQGQLTANIINVPVAPADVINLISIVGGSGLSAKRLSFGLVATFVMDTASGNAQGDFGVLGEIKGGKLRIAMDEGDGFLTEILSGIALEADFDLGFGWSAGSGVYFTGSGALEIQLPSHIDLGPIQLTAITLSVGIEGDTFPIALSTNINANLGPLQAVVEQIGVSIDLSFPPDGDGNIGPVDLGFSFKPPNGVGLSIDAGVVKGGGYLYFDFDKEEYAGVLELDLSGIVSVKAIGLITTRMPDGSEGFSLLLILTAEFGTPLQLGFGFTLSGVGGLLGLSRTMRLEEIATGIRDGGINSIMFPQNVVENAPRIISDLNRYFPVEADTFLIGPMVQIGWGTPNLVTVSLGIIIEIPGNIAILGVLKVVLPDEDAALIIIQVNFIGAIEFDKNRLWFFAALFESRVLYITLEGEMGLLVAWGEDASFVVSVGGFHPAFNPPPLPFGAVARISISILNTDFARIQIQGYFAVTSNSVQFGASVDLFFGLDAFNIDGHLAFDALFRFSPFYFIITISASLSVKVFGAGLFSVHMRGSLEGPTPWHVEGTGSISLLFFDIDVDFSHTWGNEAETTLPPIIVMPLLVEEYQKADNWLAVLPASNQLLVSLREIEGETADLILHPVGSLKVSQRLVPLGLTVDKIGNQKPSDANKFDVTVSTSGLDVHGEVKESFAVGQFFDKSDSELLNAKSFEPMKSGLELSVAGEQYHAPLAVKRVVRYEKIIIDTNFKRFIRPFYTWIGSLFGLFLNGNAASRSVLSYKQQKELKPFSETVTVGTTLYSVAFTEDNTAYAESAMSFTSQVQAQEYMNQQIAGDANLAQQIHVIPQVEMQRTA